MRYFNNWLRQLSLYIPASYITLLKVLRGVGVVIVILGLWLKGNLSWDASVSVVSGTYLGVVKSISITIQFC